MIVVLMGVTGSGKTTLGLRLASDLGWRFIDAEDFRTAGGDADRAPQAGSDLLTPVPDNDAPSLTLHAEIAGALSRGENVVLADGALTGARRDELSDEFSDIQFVHLKGNAALLRQRLRNRSGHFMGEDTLMDQLAIIEEPAGAIAIDVDERPGRIVERLRDALGI